MPQSKDSVVSAGNHADLHRPGPRFCEEGLNDAGQLTFIADFEDSTMLEHRPRSSVPLQALKQAGRLVTGGQSP